MSSMNFGGGGSDIPAWVQAVGSVLAIIAAIWIGERQSARAERTRRLEQQKLVRLHARSLLTKFRAILHEVSHRRQVVASFQRTPPPPEEKFKIGDADKLLRRLYLDSAQALPDWDMIALHFPSDLGIEVVNVIDNCQGYNRTIRHETATLADVMTTENEYAEWLKTVDGKLWEIGAGITEISTQLNFYGLYDPTPRPGWWWRLRERLAAWARGLVTRNKP